MKTSYKIIILSAILILVERRFANFYSDIIFYFLVPLISSYILRLERKQIGLSFGKTNEKLRLMIFLFLLGLPIMYFASNMPQFYNYYPMYVWAGNTPANFVKYEILILFSMLSCEFFFRGFIMLGTSKNFGKFSILLQDVPYFLVHIGKPPLEVPYSFFVGVIFGYIDYEAESIAPSLILHYGSSVIFDLLCLVHAQ